MSRIDSQTFKSILISCGIALTAILVGYLSDWFYILSLGVIIAITTILFVVFKLRGGEGEGSYGCGCLITILFVVLAIIYNETRYISPHGNKQHIYSDCPSILKSTHVKEVRELEGFFHLTFSDCKLCTQRKKAERKRRLEEKRERERLELIEYLQSLIVRLQNGEYASRIEDELRENFAPDEDGYIPGVPSRYQ